MASKAATLLKDYQAKRDFTKTQEPSGNDASKASGNLFVVQKHDATRLHYDFRIELDGVLKSWAVTKGPSDNPADKRLAVRVEDHPLDYGQFEGTIPKNEYGGGTVMLWDQGTWEPIGDPQKGLQDGDLKMRLHGQRMQGEWVLVHMKGRNTKRKSGPDRENWLLIKHRDDDAKDQDTLTERFTKSVNTGRDMAGIAKGLKPKKATKTKPDAVWHSDPDKAVDNPGTRKTTGAGTTGKVPQFRPPQLATLTSDVPEGHDWVFEMKYDGYRCQAAIAGDQVRLFTRNGKDWTTQFAVIVPPLSRITEGSALIDGELCAFDSKGHADFSTLKKHLSDGGPLTFFAFDLLEEDGEDLAALKLTERKARLETLLGKVDGSSLVQLATHVTGNGQKVLEAVCREGHEGIIAKQADAPYRSDRNRNWLKIKCVRRQEFVIAGWSPSSKKQTFASLLLGTWDGGKLTYRGRVGSGFTVDQAEQLQHQLDSRSRKTSPFSEVPKTIARTARWITPELVAEIGYAEFTPDGILRHPSFIGLREDKPASDIVLEQPLDQSKDARLDAKAGIAAADKAGVRLTSPDRVAYPGQGVTKAELVAYYAAVAPRMLPYVANRPLSLLRCPQGRAKYCFFQKHDTGGFPDAMKSLLITEKDGSKEDYFYIDDLAGLIAGTQMNVLEWHLWGARNKDIEKPERIIFDIDPDEGLDFADVRAAATDIRDVLEALGLKSYPLVSGGKGVHVIAPLTPRIEWPEVKAFCKGLAQKLAGDQPDRYVATMSKAKRKGKLFIDYLRNERGSTAIAPWSSRSREGAPAAVPVTWDELRSIKRANQFSLAAAAERSQGPDPWTDYFDINQSITKAMLKAVAD